MEPLSSAAIAVATLILNKASEETGKELGKAISHQIGKLGQLVKGKAPKTAAIEQADQPVDYGQAVLELESATKTNSELSQTVEELAAAVQADPKLAQLVPAYAEKLEQSQPTTIQNYGKLADEIKNLFQGNTFNAPVTFN